MGNVWRVFKRDVLRLLKVPPALVVVLALLVLPSVYTWYNVVGFWNPYDNTGNLRVCVVNEDAGGKSDLTGELHVGDMIVDELHENTQLDWAFTDRDAAMRELESGESYAAFVIPENFTEQLLSLTTGDFTQPKLEYYVNEKAGPVAPKITDTGASTLDETINSTFVSTVSDVAADAIDQALDESRETMDASRSRAVSEIAEVVRAVGDARASFAEISSATDQAQGKVGDARDALGRARTAAGTASDALSTISDLTMRMQSELAGFSAAAMPAVSQGLAAVSQASSKANEAASGLIGAAGEAQGSIGTTLAQGQAVVDESKALAAYLRELADSQVDETAKQAMRDIADELDRNAADAEKTLEGLGKLNDQAGSATQAVSQASDSLNAAVQQAASGAEAYSNSLFGTTIPAVNESLAQLGATSASLATAVSNQRLLIDQAQLVLDQLSSTLGVAKDALGQTDGMLGDLERDMDTVRTDVLALSESDALTKAFGEDGLDASKIADFMGSPTELVTEQLYELNAYGSAMAPLFMNLTFWIGAFMLLVIMKQEVDGEGIRNLTVTQRYLGRFLLLAAMAVLQAVICCAGVLALGVQAANAAALFFAAAVASLSYLSIIYALSVTLQHIGKGICIVLVFAQIPGATGLYPIEMTSGFFQAVYPFFPFTYGIGAMREAICGFYGSHYADAIGTLALFFALFMALGLLVRPLMANVNRMVAGQVRESGIFNGEDVEIPARPYRFSQLFRALSDKDEYREELQARYERFARWYPRLIRASVALGLSVPVALTVVFALTPTEKVWLLTAWLVWLVAVFVFLVVLESLRASFERQMRLDDMTEEGLLGLGAARNAMERSGAETDANASSDVDADCDASDGAEGGAARE
ncbi:YhgE/Pip domain-containing protein [Gordonibacter sp. 28C]|uniref:YhgE/Pip domain-containing protein n=1 Tax=Gordonibacter sp. 28C TaxID=2078569 RepID=UPI000DF7798B|nr:YhgE/Pip domain-containing protein [Gordonibacter sp. 28C]RDB63868.1 YhgE/Pip domain-containing protein [Gordonibacter sp. 28C]